MKKLTAKVNLNPISLLLATLGDYRSAFLKLLVLASIVTVPASVLRIISLDGGITDFSIVAAITGLYVNLALYWAFANKSKINKTKLGQIYVNGSARFLPFVGITIILASSGLIAALGFLLVILSVAEVVNVWLFVPGLLIGLAILWLLVRLSLAGVITATEEFGILTSLRASWLASKKRFFKLLLAWLALILAVVLLSGIILSGVYRIPVIYNNQFAMALAGGILASILLPFVIGYTVQIWNRIKLA